MSKTIYSDVIVIDKSVSDIEQELVRISQGEIIRWAVTDVLESNLKISYSYKK